LTRYAELLVAVGALPEELHLLRSEAVLRQMADEMVDAMMKVEAGDMTPAEAGALFRRMVRVEEPPRALSG
jgi:hypothetical protein